MAGNLASRLKAELWSRYSLVPKDQWLNSFLSTITNTSQPLPALTSTAQFRLIQTDFTNTLSAERGQLFPANIVDVNRKDVVLQTDTPVQVLDIQDVGTSKYAQIEAIERVERGEEIRGREIVRRVPGAMDDDEDDGSTNLFITNGAGDSTSTNVSHNHSGNSSRKGSSGPHKLLLQDAAGTKCWCFELSRIERITIVIQDPLTPAGNGVSPIQRPVEGMQVGSKLMLKRSTKIKRGLIMLTPNDVNVLGGKIEIWDQKWRETRKVRLQMELDRESARGHAELRDTD